MFAYDSALVSGVTAVPSFAREGDLATTEHPTGEGKIFYVDDGFWSDGGVGSASGIAEVADDTSPTLGGPLDINNQDLLGTVDNTGLVLDGGLL